MSSLQKRISKCHYYGNPSKSGDEANSIVVHRTASVPSKGADLPKSSSQAKDSLGW
jgi:hypothetical protein